MGTDQFRMIVRQRTFTSYVIWIAFTGAVFLYGAVLYVILMEKPDPILSEGSFHLLVALAGGLAFSGIGLHRFLGRESYLRSSLRTASEDQLATIKQNYPELTEEETKLVYLLPNLFIQTLLPLVFIEGVAILGFVATLTSTTFLTYIYFASVTFLLQLTVYPRRERFLNQCRAVIDDKNTFR